MAAKQLICSGNLAGVPTPTWDQIEEAIDRWDDSIWLEGEGEQQLSATRIDLIAMGLPPAHPDADRQAWYVCVLNPRNEGSACLVARYGDTDYVPAEIAKAGIRNWFEQHASFDTRTLEAGAAWRWV